MCVCVCVASLQCNSKRWNLLCTLRTKRWTSPHSTKTKRRIDPLTHPPIAASYVLVREQLITYYFWVSQTSFSPWVCLLFTVCSNTLCERYPAPRRSSFPPSLSLSLLVSLSLLTGFILLSQTKEAAVNRTEKCCGTIHLFSSSFLETAPFFFFLLFAPFLLPPRLPKCFKTQCNGWSFTTSGILQRPCR